MLLALAWSIVITTSPLTCSDIETVYTNSDCCFDINASLCLNALPSCNAGDILRFNGSQWECSDLLSNATALRALHAETEPSYLKNTAPNVVCAPNKIITTHSECEVAAQSVANDLDGISGPTNHCYGGVPPGCWYRSLPGGIDMVSFNSGGIDPAMACPDGNVWSGSASATNDRSTICRI